MIPPCIPWLLADAGVTAIVGENVFLDVAPPGTVGPYVAVTVITGVSDNLMDDAPKIDNWRVQADSYADAGDGGTQSLALAAAVRAVFQRHGQKIATGIVGKDVDADLFRYGEDWSFWVHR